jgi:hypothetical protein
VISTLLESSIVAVAEAYFAIRIIFIAALIVLAVCIIGSWLTRKRRSGAEDRESE